MRHACVLAAPAVSQWIDKEHGLSQLLTPDRDGDGKGDALVGGPIVEARPGAVEGWDRDMCEAAQCTAASYKQHEPWVLARSPP